MAKAHSHKGIKGEKFLIYLVLALMSALYLLFVGACEKQPSSSIKEQDEALYRAGQAELKRGDYNSALKAFLKLIDERKDCPQSHLEAGRVYLFSLKDYVFAIYHLKKFIEIESVLNPDSHLIVNVKQMVETAQKRMITSLPQSPYEDNEGLESAIAKLKQENYELKQSIVSYSSTIKKLEAKLATYAASPQRTQSYVAGANNATSTNSQNATQSATQNNTRRIARNVNELRQVNVQRDIPDTYTVKAGDTLSSISTKFYGTSAKWTDILRYNSSTLSSPQALRIGQVLRLPKL